MKESLYDYCRRVGKTELLSQWNTVRNGRLTPHDLSSGSSGKVWWTCKEGHEWQAAVWTRTSQGSGCPVCTGHLTVPGTNDLQTLNPALAAQWHPEKNGDLRPCGVAPGTRRKVWWRCEAGHEWQASVKSRQAGCGCPVCAGKVLIPGENDLATIHPALAAEWNRERNGSLTPRDVMAGSRRKVWWRCGYGHEWQAFVSSRSSSNSGCPVCAGKLVVAGENDLATLCPMAARQWHPSRNGRLKASEVSAFSNRKVWWRCEEGHEWCAEVKERTARQKGCPYCTGRRVLKGYNDLETLHPDIAAQWYQPFNGTLTPQDVTAGSTKKVWWQCSEGHIWKAVIYSRTGARKHGCPECAANGRRGQVYYRTELSEVAGSR